METMGTVLIDSPVSLLLFIAYERRCRTRMLIHPFDPLYDENSRILILGSFPSVKSREVNFYYGHPRNRFWQLMAILLGEELPSDVPGKRAMLLRHGIALYDVIASCDITGSSDSSIRNARVSDLSPILSSSQIGDRIFVNGKKAGDLYRKYTWPVTGIPCRVLPSTSPANAAWSLQRLVKEWGEILALKQGY